MAIFDPRLWLLSLLLWALLLYPLWAQDRPTPKDQAYSTRILAELNANLSCTADLIALREALAKAEAELQAIREAKEPNP